MYGGRWNEPGTRAIYTAGSRSLAVLETLANYAVLPRDFAMTTVRIPKRVGIQELPRRLLTPDWQDIPQVTQMLGKAWLSQTAVLRVPSAIIPEESNYVLNPEHKDFRLIEFLPALPFRFDSRLKPLDR